MPEYFTEFVRYQGSLNIKGYNFNMPIPLTHQGTICSGPFYLFDSLASVLFVPRICLLF